MAKRHPRGSKFRSDLYGPCDYCGYPMVWLPGLHSPRSIHRDGRCAKDHPGRSTVIPSWWMAQ